MGRSKKAIFITGTDTDVGKTIATLAIGAILKKKGIDVGVMKPIACSGNDAKFLKTKLDIQDDIKDINPYYVDEPLSPNLAFARAKKEIDVKKIIKAYKTIKGNHDVTLVEGVGGLMVPIKKNYLVSDLIKDLDLEVIIVSRLSLGTINHTLLTISQAKSLGIKVCGVIFNETKKCLKGIPEKTNPEIIKKLGNIPILGTIPYLKSFGQKNIVKQCKSEIKLKRILSYTKKSRTKELINWDKKYLWHPFTQMKDWRAQDPLVIDQAEGNYLIDTDGKRYIDGVSSLWVNVHGHRNKEVDAAIRNQIDKVSHSTLLGLGSTVSIELAKRLVEISPSGLNKVFYSDNGSTSVEIAIKIAYQYWQNVGQKKKIKIAHLENSYHGDTLGSVSVGGIDIFHKVYRNLIFETIKIGFPDCYRAPKGKAYPDYAFECLGKFEKLLKAKHKQIAAFVVEPIVQGAAGIIVWPRGVLKKMEELCKKYKVIFIVDEVATGFGRTGKMFACNHESVKPDIMCLAKGITAGYLPLAATLTTDKIYKGFLFDYKKQKTFFHGHTYTGNPLSCAAALANIDIFKKQKTIERLRPKIKLFKQGLKRFHNLKHVGDIRQKGFIIGIELVADKKTKEPFKWEKRVGVSVCQKVRERGIILRPLGNVIVLMPPLSIDIDQIKKLLDVTYWAIEEITETKDKGKR